MDRLILAEKLESLRRCITRIEQPAPATMGEAFELLAREQLISEDLARRMRSAVGFRNLAVHAYHRIDWAIVHGLTHAGIDDLRSFASRMHRLLA